jgi:hypothetical protein
VLVTEKSDVKTIRAYPEGSTYITCPHVPLPLKTDVHEVPVFAFDKVEHQ